MQARTIDRIDTMMLVLALGAFIGLIAGGWGFPAFCFGMSVFILWNAIRAMLRGAYESVGGEPEIPVRSAWGVFNTLWIIG